jgi:UDP-3-O-[3-hydroxymyristoyl] glucosamine N-acyltransferase
MMKLSEIASRIDGVLSGDGTIDICGVAGIREGGPGEISFIANPRYAAEIASTKASAVIVMEDWSADCSVALIRVKNPDAAFAKAASLFYTPAPRPVSGVHPSAVVAPDVKLGEGVSVGPLCVIESGAEIGSRTVLKAGCYVGYGSKIGTDCLLYSQVSLREFVKIGNRCILHNGTVVGSDGFGYSVDGNGVRTKIPQIGIVEIGDDVEIGANTTIDRARFGKTRIGNGVKIDNLVQIAHNVTIGDHAGIAGHLKIGAGVIVGPNSGVTKDIPDGVHVLGAPAMPVDRMKRMHAGIMLLPKMKERIAALDKRLRALERGGESSL